MRLVAPSPHFFIIQTSMIGKALIAIYQPFPIHPKANFHHIPFNPVTLFYLFFIPQLASQKSSQDNLLPDLFPQSHHIWLERETAARYPPGFFFFPPPASPRRRR